MAGAICPKSTNDQHQRCEMLRLRGRCLRLLLAIVTFALSLSIAGQPHEKLEVVTGWLVIDSDHSASFKIIGRPGALGFWPPDAVTVAEDRASDRGYLVRAAGGTLKKVCLTEVAQIEDQRDERCRRIGKDRCIVQERLVEVLAPNICSSAE